jgi:hypothetical protein
MPTPSRNASSGFTVTEATRERGQRLAERLRAVRNADADTALSFARGTANEPAAASAFHGVVTASPDFGLKPGFHGLPHDRSKKG